jgi:hypothetical protein
MGIHLSLFTYTKRKKHKLMSNYKYTDEIEARIRAVVGTAPTEETIQSLVEELQFPRRSVTAKLRSMGYTVPTMAEAPKFSAEETKALTDFLTAKSGTLTADEVSKAFADGKFTARQIMGKALSLELTSHLKQTEKAAKPRTYSPEEESKIAALVGQGKFLEEIADALGKSVNSIRGKLLSMELKAPQRDKKQQASGGAYPNLEVLAPTMTVDELVAHYNKDNAGTPKTARGVKTALSRRSIQAKDYPSKKGE